MTSAGHYLGGEINKTRDASRSGAPAAIYGWPNALRQIVVKQLLSTVKSPHWCRVKMNGSYTFQYGLMKAASTCASVLSAIAVISAFSFVILFLPGAGDTPGQSPESVQQSAAKERQPVHLAPQEQPSEAVSG